MKKKGIRKGIEMAGITAGMILAVMIFTYIYYVENVGSSYLDTELSVVMSQQFLDKNCIKMGVIFYYWSVSVLERKSSRKFCISVSFCLCRYPTYSWDCL